MLMDIRWPERPEEKRSYSGYVRNALWLIAGLLLAIGIIFGFAALGLGPPEIGPM
jgi:hypothetical protein